MTGRRSRIVCAGLAAILVAGGCSASRLPAQHAVDEARDAFGLSGTALETRVFRAFLLAGVDERRFEASLDAAIRHAGTWPGYIEQFAAYGLRVDVGDIRALLCRVDDGQLAGDGSDARTALQRQYRDVLAFDRTGASLAILEAVAAPYDSPDPVDRLARWAIDCTLAGEPL
jgi:hypothetical protein